MEEVEALIYKLPALLIRIMILHSILGKFQSGEKIIRNELMIFLFFFSNRSDNKELNNLVLTYKNIDKKTFFAIPVQFKSINDIIEELDKSSELKWPSRHEKEVHFFHY